MLAALSCDLCGKLYRPYGNNINGKQYNGFRLVRSVTEDSAKSWVCSSDLYDLCPDCMKELYAFINKRKEESSCPGAKEQSS